MQNFKTFQIAEATSSREIQGKMDKAVFEKMAEVMSKEMGSPMKADDVQSLIMSSPKLRKTYESMRKDMMKSFDSKKAAKGIKESEELSEAAPKAKQKVSAFVSDFTKQLGKTVTQVKQRNGNANTMIDLSVQKTIDKHAKAIISALLKLDGF